MKRLKISTGGQVSVPATIRHRWKTRALVAEDRGDHLVLRPEPEDPIEALAGSLAHFGGPSSDEIRGRFREEEALADERKHGPAAE